MSVSDTIRALVDAVKKSGATTEADIQAQVFDAYAKLFNPCDLDDKDLLKVAGKIAKSATPATAFPATPFQQRTGATGLHNPALGTAEEHFSLPLPVTESVIDSRDRDRNSVTGHGNPVTSVTPVTESVTDEEKIKMREKLAMLEQKLADQKAEMEAQAERDLESRSRMEANAQAKREAEKEEQERAEQAQAERDRIRELENRSRAEAAEKAARSREAEIRSRAEAAAAQAARDLAAAEAAAAEKAERGSVTDEQIELATAVIRTAIVEGHIQKVGSPQTSPILKAAGLPTSSDTLKILSKYACKQLETEKLVVQNPNKANGQPLYLIA